MLIYKCARKSCPTRCCLSICDQACEMLTNDSSTQPHIMQCLHFIDFQFSRIIRYFCLEYPYLQVLPATPTLNVKNNLIFCYQYWLSLICLPRFSWLNLALLHRVFRLCNIAFTLIKSIIHTSRSTEISVTLLYYTLQKVT